MSGCQHRSSCWGEQRASILTSFIISDQPLTFDQTRPANAAGFLIHSQIHKARPDVHAICHAHTDAGRAWSVFAKPLEMLNQDICNFYNAHAVYAEYGGIVFAEEEGRNIAKALGTTNKASSAKS